MKKFLTIIAVLLGFASQWHARAEAPLTTPEAGKDYYIVHSSGYLLTYTGSALKFTTPQDGLMQTFQFVPVAGMSDTYNILLPDGKYLGSDSGYSVKIFDDGGDSYAMFQIELYHTGTEVIFKNVGRGAYLGSDSNSDGSGVYTDKGGNDGKHSWLIVEKKGAVYTGVLEKSIASAKDLTEAAVAGTEVGNYPQSAIDDLNSAIATAETYLVSTDQTAVNDANTALNAAITSFKAQQVTMSVDTSKKYNLVQLATGKVLSINSGEKAKIKDLDGSASQQYIFVPVEGADYTYNLKLADESGYLVTSGNWDTAVGTDPSADVAKWKFSLYGFVDEVPYYNLKGTKGLLGSDGTSEGSTVYSNKGDSERARWQLVEVVEGVIITEALENTIASAKAALEGITIGDETTNYPQAAVDALNAEIAAAEAVLAAPGNQENVNNTTSDLSQAISAFKATKIIFKTDPAKQYYIIQKATDYVMAVNSSNVGCIEAPAGTDNQKFYIKPAFEGSGSCFNLQMADGRYLIRKGGWDTAVGDNPSESVAIWEFVIQDLENGYYNLKKYNEGGYVGTDALDDGAWIYCNKGDNDRGRWQIIEAVEGELLMGAYEKALATAEDLLANAEVSDEVGGHTQAAVDALTAVVNQAKANTYTTQAQVNEAASGLNTAVAEFEADAVEKYFNAENGVAYRFSTNKYPTKFMTNIDGSAKTTADYTAGNVGQHWTLQPVEGREHAYILKNQDKVLDYEGNLIEATDAEAPLWRTIYCKNTDTYMENFALVQAEDPTKVVTFGSGKTWAIQTLSKTNSAHYGRFIRVDAVNDANLAALELAIARAESKLAGVTVGNEIGQYSQAKCDAMQALIDEAKTYYTGKEQADVDAKATELKSNTDAFINNPNTVIKDELEAQLKAGDEKAAAAEIGIEEGQYKWSEINEFNDKLAAFKAEAAKVTEQEVCDSLTAVVKDFVDAFTGHATEQEVKTILDDAIVCAEAVYEAEKDNVGSDMGQRPQEAVDAFAAAIAKAKAIAEPELADLQALLDAYNAFLNGAVSVDRTALRKAIIAASDEKYADLKGGEFDGQYPQATIDAFTAALAAAKAVEADMEKTQEDVNAATQALNAARTALDKAQVHITFTKLDAALKTAQDAVAAVKVVGEGEGACPQAAVDEINAVIAKATAIDRASINQSDVDALEAELKDACAKFSAEVKKAVGLAEVIEDAEDLANNATAGFKPGNYPSSAIAALNAAIAAAKAANEAEVVAQDDLLAALKNLKDAIATFEAEVIPAHDLTELEALVAEVEAYIKDGGEADLTLTIALSAAKDVLDNPNDYTKAEVNNALADLKNAYTPSGIAAISLEGVRIANGTISFAGTDAACAVYSIDGRLVAASTGESLTLNPGTYVIIVNANGQAVRRVVRVK